MPACWPVEPLHSNVSTLKDAVMKKLLTLIAALVALGWSNAALAEVKVSFHSFNGSVLFGRYPHTFVVLEGTLDENGKPVNENFGFTAKNVSPAILTGPVEHSIMVEKPKYIDSTNRHFTMTISDDQYFAIKRELEAWRSAPGKFYDLDTRNCIHFVGKIAQILGLQVSYPRKLLRKPKAWLNHVTRLNPRLGARPVG